MVAALIMDAAIRPRHVGVKVCPRSFRDGPKHQTSDAQMRIGETRAAASGFSDVQLRIKVRA